MKRTTTICICLFAGCLVFFGWKLTARAAYESAEYKVIESEDSFEIREYPDLMLAATPSGIESRGNDGSFMRLFRYISGANEQKQKIAMTTPVFMGSDESQTAGESESRMGFVLPKEVANRNAPQPTSEDVEIRKRKGGRFAVIRFAGRVNAKSRAKATKELQLWIQQKELTADGAPEYAGYDPPWTPGPLRRNEVLIRLK